MEYEIYWGDLNEETQNELLELMGDKGNLDVIPIATIPIEMEESPLRILKVEPGEVPYEKEIKDDLHSVQEEVGGGLFQPVYLDDGIVLCCNEEGKLNGMAPNRWLGGDIVCGPFFLVGDDGEGGFVSLTDEQMAECQEMFGEPVQFQGNEPQLDPRLEFYYPW
jgi:hypothetical protein